MTENIIIINKESKTINSFEDFENVSNEYIEKINLGDRMKQYEEEYNDNILPFKPFILRFDGKCFSKFTRNLKKPFDKKFVDAMVMTVNDTIDKYTEIVTGYTHSDEITLIFNKICTKEEYENKINKSVHIFDGRIIKILTIISSYISVRFNFHLANLINQNKTEYSKTFVELVNKFEQCFDGRVLVFPDDKDIEIANHMYWRSVYDCHKNAVSTYAYAHYSHKQTDKKNTSEKIAMLLEKNVDWDDVPIYYKHGVYIKKSNYEKKLEDNTVCTRTEIIAKCFKINTSIKMLDLLLAKRWNNNEFEQNMIRYYYN